MGGIWIFGGTSEGRRLADFCARHGLPAGVSVATEYGEQALPGELRGTVLKGRMSEEQMREHMRACGVELVIDATHPYAVEVTGNIRRACGAESVEYIRLVRADDRSMWADRGTAWVDSAAEAAAYLAETHGNIMLATGSKELPVFCGILDTKRLYPRILPSMESLKICEDNGIPLANCIAMQGPFSEELNIALLKQYRCRFLVTKESGTAGGFEDKITACQKNGVTAVVIRRPVVEEGMDFSEVCGYLAKKYGFRLCEETLENQERIPKQEQEEQKGQKEIDIVGIGMGTEKTMTGEARRIIDEADILIGGGRMLEGYESNGKGLYRCYQAEEIRRFVDSIYFCGNPGDAGGSSGSGVPSGSGDSSGSGIPSGSRSLSGSIAPSDSRTPRIAILVSGDVGFYSGAGKLLVALDGYKVRLHPGISSVVYMASRIGTPWQDMALCSVHGRSQNLLGKIRHHQKVFTLAGKCEEIHQVCSQLIRHGMERVEVCVGENLSYENERIWRGSPAECLNETFENLLVAVFLHAEYQKRTAGFGIPDEAFIRGKVPMTKEEVRTLSLSKLKLTKDAVVYDVGAGTGSVSIEAALAAEDGMVYAIERKAEAADLIEKNAEKFAAANLEVIRGTAPEVFAGLPAPTHAFIGGSAGNLKSIVAQLREKNPGVRIVINAISLETISEMTELSKIHEMELVTVNIARANPVGDYQLMTGQNPVMIGTLGGR